MISNLKENIRKIYFKLLGQFNLSVLLSNELHGFTGILDAACGYSSSIKAINNAMIKIGIDHYLPYIIKSREAGYHNDYVLGDIKCLPFAPKSFDCVVATEVLEHMEKENGINLLNELARVARKKVIVTTPNGYVATYPGPDDNPEEKHLSGWTVDELKSMGYRVYGIYGFRWFWHVKEGRAQLRTPTLLFTILVDLSEIIAYKNPRMAFGLLIINEISRAG